jgi:hypothetical protein
MNYIISKHINTKKMNNISKPLRDLSDLLFDLKEHITDEQYLNAMTNISNLHGLGKKVLLAIPMAHEIHLDTFHKRFDLGIELVYITITKDDYPLYNELEAGASFEIDLYPPLKLLYKTGLFKYNFLTSQSIDDVLGITSSASLSCQSITGRVIQCYQLKTGTRHRSLSTDSNLSSNSIEPF